MMLQQVTFPLTTHLVAMTDCSTRTLVIVTISPCKSVRIVSRASRPTTRSACMCVCVAGSARRGLS